MEAHYKISHHRKKIIQVSTTCTGRYIQDLHRTEKQCQNENGNNNEHDNLSFQKVAIYTAQLNMHIQNNSNPFH